MTLTGDYYSAAAQFAAERREILSHSWELVGQEHQLATPGSYIATEIAGAKVFTIRGEDGTIRAFRNLCTHRGARLLDDGLGQCPQIRCRYHDWRFDHSGQLVDTPWFGEASPFDRDLARLYPLSVEVWRGLVFISLDPVEPLIEQLGDVPEALNNAPLEEFRIMASRTISVPINWKLYIDQYCEAYHVPTTHAPDKAVDIQNYDTRPYRNMMLMRTVGEDATRAASYYGGRWIWAWPNWTVALFDGGMKTSRVRPISPTETIVHYDFYFADGSEAVAAARDRVVDATISIFWEDIAGCQLIQDNFPANDFHSGQLHPTLERAVHYFHERVRAATRPA
jgi:choline monooxygenase